ncbi:MAG: hypothetical protein DSY66_03720 [Persephonella sp.]|nr:MAG: hypothetical protein DSY66_03720 [Persephonella sp.]
MLDLITLLKNVKSKKEGFDVISEFAPNIDNKVLKAFETLLKGKETKSWFKEFYTMIETAVILNETIFPFIEDREIFLKKLKSLDIIKSRYAVYMFLYHSKSKLIEIDKLLSELEVLIDEYGIKDEGVNERNEKIKKIIQMVNGFFKIIEILLDKIKEKSSKELDLVCDFYLQNGILSLYQHKISILLKENLSNSQQHLKRGSFFFEKLLDLDCPPETKIYSLLNLSSMYRHYNLCKSINCLNLAKNELKNIDKKEIYENLELEINRNLSSIFLDLGRYENCYNLLKPYIEKLERKIFKIFSPQLILEFINKHKYIYENMVICCIELGKVEKKYKEKALEYLEKINSRVFLESWRLKLNTLDLESNKELANRRKKLLEELNYLSFYIPEDKNEELNILRINQILEELGTLEDLLIRNNKFKIFYLKAHPVNLEEENVFSLIPENTLLLEYFLTKDKIYMFIINNKGILDIKDIKFKDINLFKGILNIFLQILIRENFTSYKELEDNIPEFSSLFEPEENLIISYDLLIKPVYEFIKNKEMLYIIPYGELAKLPFHALIKKENGEETFLIEEIPIAYLPSLSVFRILKNEEENSDKCLVIGLPEKKGGPKLAEKEAKLVAKLCNFQPYPAKKDIFLKEAEGKNIIHISTHSVNEKILINYNGLLFEDGVLLPQEIEMLTIKASLVFLSACSTYLEDVNPSIKYISLTGSFIKAGARTVIATLLPIASYPTYMLVEEFYKNLKKGYSKAKSLQRAQLRIINDYSWHPYFWGTFFLIGLGD